MLEPWLIILALFPAIVITLSEIVFKSWVYITDSVMLNDSDFIIYAYSFLISWPIVIVFTFILAINLWRWFGSVHFLHSTIAKA